MKLQISRDPSVNSPACRSRAVNRRRPLGLALALALSLGVGAAAHADDAASLRQELDSLRSKIEQIDADITDTGRGSAALKDESDAYCAAKVQTNTATGQELEAAEGAVDGRHGATRRRARRRGAGVPQIDHDDGRISGRSRQMRYGTAVVSAACRCVWRRPKAPCCRLRRLRGSNQGPAGRVQNHRAKAPGCSGPPILAARNAARKQLNRFDEVRDRLTALQAGPK